MKVSFRLKENPDRVFHGRRYDADIFSYLDKQSKYPDIPLICRYDDIEKVWRYNSPEPETVTKDIVRKVVPPEKHNARIYFDACLEGIDYGLIEGIYNGNENIVYFYDPETNVMVYAEFSNVKRWRYEESDDNWEDGYEPLPEIIYRIDFRFWADKKLTQKQIDEIQQSIGNYVKFEKSDFLCWQSFIAVV